MSTFDEVVARVRKQSRVGRSVKIDETTTLEELGLSSLQVADLIFSLVEDLDIKIDEERAAQLRTLGEFVALLDEALARKEKDRAGKEMATSK
jgi:acyl carrier protein